MNNLDLIITKQELPVVEFNFEDTKKALTENLEFYKQLIVTDDTLSVCKAQQKNLAGLRTKIDNYRKEIKKVMSAPIAVFEGKCNDLITLIGTAEQPLKDGIKVFDDQKREEKRQSALSIIAETIVKHGLTEKYSSQLTVLDKYTNLTAKTSEVREDVEQRAFILLGQQQKEIELLELIQDAINTANQRIKRQLTLAEFQRYIDMEMSTKDIIQAINSNAQRIYEAENPKPVEPVEPITETYLWKANPSKEPKQEVTAGETPKEDPLWYADMRITATASNFAKIKEFLLSNNITYSVKDKGLV